LRFDGGGAGWNCGQREDEHVERSSRSSFEITSNPGMLSKSDKESEKLCPTQLNAEFVNIFERHPITRSLAWFWQMPDLPGPNIKNDATNNSAMDRTVLFPLCIQFLQQEIT